MSDERGTIRTKPFPKTIGTCCDRLMRFRDTRIALQKQADEIKKEERELEAHTAKLLRAQKLTTGAGKIATFSIGTPKVIATITDWPKFFAWMADNEALDMVQRRVANKAFVDRLEVGEAVPPGLERGTVPNYSLTKKKR